MTVLFTTNVGSHMWGMQRPDSDKDLATVYMMSGEHFLEGKHPNNHFSQRTDDEGVPVDEQRYEIQHVVNQIKKMNVNFVWAIMSPIILVDKSNFLQELRQIIADNRSKQIYWSIQGMARNNIKKFIERGEIGSRKYKKKLNVIARTIKFGINYLLYGKCIFEATYITTKVELDALMIQLSNAYNASPFPDKPKQEPFDKFLRKLRLYSLWELVDDDVDRGHKNKKGGIVPLFDRLGGKKL